MSEYVFLIRLLGCERCEIFRIINIDSKFRAELMAYFFVIYACPRFFRCAVPVDLRRPLHITPPLHIICVKHSRSPSSTPPSPHHHNTMSSRKRSEEKAAAAAAVAAEDEALFGTYIQETKPTTERRMVYIINALILSIAPVCMYYLFSLSLYFCAQSHHKYIFNSLQLLLPRSRHWDGAGDDNLFLC